MNKATEGKGTSVWLSPDDRDQADKIVHYLQRQPGQYGTVSRSSVIRAALDALHRELGLGEPESIS